MGKEGAENMKERWRIEGRERDQGRRKAQIYMHEGHIHSNLLCISPAHSLSLATKLPHRS